MSEKRKCNLPLKGRQSFINMQNGFNITGIPVLKFQTFVSNAIRMSPPLVRNKLSFICNFTARKHDIFNKQDPTKTLEESSKRCSIHVLKKRNLLPNDMVSLHAGNIIVPYVACMPSYQHLCQYAEFM